MRFFIDMPLTPQLETHLGSLGHDALHAGKAGMARASDRAILQRTRDEARVVVTADLDLARLMAEIPARSPGVILLRGGAFTDQEMIEMVTRVLQAVAAEMLSDSLIVVDRYRIRRRRLPL